MGLPAPVRVASSTMAARILIVDDHPVVRTAIRAILESHSLQVCGEAEDGRKAVELVLSLKPEIVLLDINMPGMDGLSASGEIRRVSPSTKIVFLTVHEARSVIAESTRPFSDGFVAKSRIGFDLLPVLERLCAPSGREAADLGAKASKYAWHRFLLDACNESRSEDLPRKINEAERAISRRLLDMAPMEKEESRALKEALETLRKLIPKPPEYASGNDEQIA